MVIELHDPIIGPGVPRYVPTYLLHAKPGSFNELWGYEFMVVSLDDILSRRAVSLYYVNLAYSIPVYLHVDLRKDNDNGLLFWWYASTCRHLGFGGKHPDAKIWQMHKDAMRTYLRLKPFFAQGEFYSIDEMIHIHVLKSRQAAVVNCFNIQEKAETRTFRLELPRLGLPAENEYTVKGAQSVRRDGDALELTVKIPGHGTELIEVSAK